MSGRKNIGQIIHNFKFWIIIFASIAVAGGIFAYKNLSGEKVYSGEVTIEYLKDKGFIPERIVVKKGTRITFKNLSGRDFWPASDFYPQNSLYPDFDPKKVIATGGSWEFTFENIGTWGYHDHLNPINKGVIVVTDSSGNLISIKDNCSNLGSLAYNQRQLCWYNQIKDAVKKGGVAQALKLFSNLYNKEPLFSQGCHDAMHLIGDEAYREYRKGKKFDFTIETSYCGYGFYHGFIEAMLYTTADYTEVRNFCESANANLKTNIESPNAIYSCYHGIGHSTFDAHNPSLWGDEHKMVDPAIVTCEKVTKGLSEEKTKQCVTGVFNALGIAYSNGLYNLKMNPKDPVWYCRGLKNVLYKKACFSEVVMAWISSTMGNFNYKFADGARFISNLHDNDGATSAMFAFSSEFARLHINELSNSELLSNCNTVPGSLFASCREGVELALLNWGKPGEEYKRLLDFCSGKFSADQKTACFQYAFRGLTTIYSKDKRVSICQNVPQEFQNMCLNMN